MCVMNFIKTACSVELSINISFHCCRCDVCMVYNYVPLGLISFSLYFMVTFEFARYEFVLYYRSRILLGPSFSTLVIVL